MATRDPLSPAAEPPPATTSLRRFGRFQMRRLLGRSARTTAWLAWDPRDGREVMLVLPRHAPAPEALAPWLQDARRAARLQHPRLAPALEVGEVERWPFVTYDRALGTTLAERLTDEGVAPAQAARWIADALEGLAFAHDAGAAHRDLQLHHLVVDAGGAVCVAGLEAAPNAAAAAEPAGGARALSIDPQQLQAQRRRAQRDVLTAGLLLHHLLAGRPALGEPDAGAVADRLPPAGRELVKLPFDIVHSVPEPLRAIVDRATDRQPRQRYFAARTFARALQGWIDFDSAHDGGAHALLLERVDQIGALPAAPGAVGRTARLAAMERERIGELAQIALRDFALSFELLRMANTAQVRGGQIAGNGPVLTVRRAIALVGLEGIQRAANALRPWPGPLREGDACELALLVDQVRRAGRIAQALRPPGYDAEVVFIVTLLQNLGRLLVHYHFPEEAQQVRRLMQAQPAAEPGAPDEPGMGEAQAAFAVFGCDLEAMGAAVARRWGLDDAALHMVRRLPLGVPVRTPDHDDDVLRAVASAANEALDALAQPPRRVAAALDRVAARYARVLKLQSGDLQAAVQAALAERSADLDRAEATPAGAEAVAGAGAAA